MKLNERQALLLRFRAKLMALAGKPWSLKDRAELRELTDAFPGVRRAQLENDADAIYFRQAWDRKHEEFVKEDANRIMVKALHMGMGLQCMRYYKDTCDQLESWGDRHALHERNMKFLQRLFEIENYRKNARK